MKLSHTGATPQKQEAVKVTSDNNTRSQDRADNSQLNTPDVKLVDPNNPQIEYFQAMQQQNPTGDLSNMQLLKTKLN